MRSVRRTDERNPVECATGPPPIYLAAVPRVGADLLGETCPHLASAPSGWYAIRACRPNGGDRSLARRFPWRPSGRACGRRSRRTAWDNGADARGPRTTPLCSPKHSTPPAPNMTTHTSSHDDQFPRVIRAEWTVDGQTRTVWLLNFDGGPMAWRGMTQDQAGRYVEVVVRQCDISAITLVPDLKTEEELAAWRAWWAKHPEWH